MRFGHTQLQGLMQGRDSNYNVITTIPLSTVIMALLFTETVIQLSTVITTYLVFQIEERDNY